MPGTSEHWDVRIYQVREACRPWSDARGLATARQSLEAAREQYGDASVQYENLLYALSRCLRSADDPTWRFVAESVFDVSAAREQPPSTNLMRRATESYLDALEDRDLVAADRFYRGAMENAPAFLDAPVRERLTNRVEMLRICHVAMHGRTDEAESIAAPWLARVNEAFAHSGRITSAQEDLYLCLSLAQRLNGKSNDALRTAQELLSICRAPLTPGKEICMRRGLLVLALAQVDAGLHTEALATLAERGKWPRGFQINPDVLLARGRALLANGQAKEAVDSLRIAYGVWLGWPEPRGPYAAEAEYWLARAYLADGDSRGRWMLEQARKTLAQSSVRSHRQLAGLAAR